MAKREIKNNTWAMIATVSLVGIFASAIGFFSPDYCTVKQSADWTSCKAIAEQRAIGFWVLLAVSIFGFVISLTKRRKNKDD